jgi:hypothetical protein
MCYLLGCRFSFRLEEDSTRGVLSEALSEVLSEMLKREKSLKKVSRCAK